MALFASGVSTFIQYRRVGPIGTGLLCIQGTSFSFIGPIISTGLAGGLPLIFGVCMAGSVVEMLISRSFEICQESHYPAGIGNRGNINRDESGESRYYGLWWWGYC